VRKARRAAARRGRCLRIMFADEARFGRINRPRPCWAPIGTRPDVASQLIREYIYLYGAVAPKDGTCVYLIMPTSNTLSRRQEEANRKKSKIRVRIEHVFGAQETSAGGRLVRTIGIVRARAKIGLQNLVYNVRRLVTLERMAPA
jgi:hypothetical protein